MKQNRPPPRQRLYKSLGFDKLSHRKNSFWRVKASLIGSFSDMSVLRRQSCIVKNHACETLSLARILFILFCSLFADLLLHYCKCSHLQTAPCKSSAFAKSQTELLSYITCGAARAFLEGWHSNYVYSCYIPFFSLLINNSFECPLAARGKKQFSYLLVNTVLGVYVRMNVSDVIEDSELNEGKLYETARKAIFR